jgi:putative two-component system response regulator
MIHSASRFKKEKRPAVLVVDDLQPNIELMEAIFVKEGFQVHQALDADRALEVYAMQRIDVAVLDVMMPGINGFELCRRLKKFSEKEFLPIVLVTALNDKKSRLTGLESGADDFISKPFDTQELLMKIRSLLKLKELHEQLDHSENIIFSLVSTMEARDYYTQGHSTRVGDLAAEFGSFLGFSAEDQDILKKAGTLHDIGKVGLCETILKKPGRLTSEEIIAVRRHPVLGEQICSPLKSLNSLLPGIRHHHERWDGAGFPDNLSGERIPLMARILSIIDSFDAMVSIRPYRNNRSLDNALSLIDQESSEGQWDPALVNEFISMMRLIIKESYTHA